MSEDKLINKAFKLTKSPLMLLVNDLMMNKTQSPSRLTPSLGIISLCKLATSLMLKFISATNATIYTSVYNKMH